VCPGEDEGRERSLTTAALLIPTVVTGMVDCGESPHCFQHLSATHSKVVGRDSSNSGFRIMSFCLIWRKACVP